MEVKQRVAGADTAALPRPSPSLGTTATPQPGTAADAAARCRSRHRSAYTALHAPRDINIVAICFFCSCSHGALRETGRFGSRLCPVSEPPRCVLVSGAFPGTSAGFYPHPVPSPGALFVPLPFPSLACRPVCVCVRWGCGAVLASGFSPGAFGAFPPGVALPSRPVFPPALPSFGPLSLILPPRICSISMVPCCAFASRRCCRVCTRRRCGVR